MNSWRIYCRICTFYYVIQEIITMIQVMYVRFDSFSWSFCCFAIRQLFMAHSSFSVRTACKRSSPGTLNILAYKNHLGSKIGRHYWFQVFCCSLASWELLLNGITFLVSFTVIHQTRNTDFKLWCKMQTRLKGYSKRGIKSIGSNRWDHGDSSERSTEKLHVGLGGDDST